MNGSPWKDDEVIPMSITCPGCGCTVYNDNAAIRHPLDFIAAMRDRGWHVPVTQLSTLPTSGNKGHSCPKCAS